MVLNGHPLLKVAPIKDMIPHKVKHNGVSHGLAEVGYDIRLKQDIHFKCPVYNMGGSLVQPPAVFINNTDAEYGRFTIASAIEEFDMPMHLMGIVNDKSTWARKGISVFNTVIEPGFRGGLTLELVFHGNEDIHIPAGSGIAQVIFHDLTESACYNGKYQDQSTNPEPSRFE